MSWLSEIGQLVVGFATMNTRMHTQEENMKSVVKEMVYMKENYTKQFGQVKEHSSDMKTNIVDRIHESEIRILTAMRNDRVKK